MKFRGTFCVPFTPANFTNIIPHRYSEKLIISTGLNFNQVLVSYVSKTKFECKAYIFVGKCVYLCTNSFSFSSISSYVDGQENFFNIEFMIREVRFSSVLYVKLCNTLNEGGCAALPAFLSSLSVSQFRTAGYILGDRIALEVSTELFWELFQMLICYDNRAFLVTMIHAFVRRLKTGDLSLSDQGFLTLIPHLTEIDASKMLHHLLPLQTDSQSVTHLLDHLHIEDPVKRIKLLLPVATVPTAYVLFRTLRYVEHDHALLVRVAASLVKQGDSVSFNLASIIKEFFGLREVKGTFSLRLQPWELSRIENSFEAFSQVIRF